MSISSRSILPSYFPLLKSRLITIPYVPCTVFSSYSVRSFKNFWFCYMNYFILQSKRNLFITQQTPDAYLHPIHQHLALSFICILLFSLNTIQSIIYALLLIKHTSQKVFLFFLMNSFATTSKTYLHRRGQCHLVCFFSL